MSAKPLPGFTDSVAAGARHGHDGMRPALWPQKKQSPGGREPSGLFRLMRGWYCVNSRPEPGLYKLLMLTWILGASIPGSVLEVPGSPLSARRVRATTVVRAVAPWIKASMSSCAPVLEKKLFPAPACTHVDQAVLWSADIWGSRAGGRDLEFISKSPLPWRRNPSLSDRGGERPCSRGKVPRARRRANPETGTRRPVESAIVKMRLPRLSVSSRSSAKYFQLYLLSAGRWHGGRSHMPFKPRARLSPA